MEPPTTTVKTPPEEPNPITTTKPMLSFANGVTLKHHRFHHRHSPPDHGDSYRECQKNHAAAMGGHAVDGCGEFMHPPPSSSLSLLCAACGCHRNFHRRVSASPENRVSEYLPLHRHLPPPPLPPPELSPSSASPPPISSTYYPSAPHMLMALSTNPNANTNANVCSNPSPSSSARKRFRTRFTQTQKEKMFEFAERLGWKMQRRDEDLINGFCNSIGVEKGVFKVWMHNNKNTLGRRDSSDVVVNNGINLDNTPLDSTNNNNNNNNYRNRGDSHHEVQRNGVAGEVSGNLVGTNGSSSSS